jgi:hypothetical protein
MRLGSLVCGLLITDFLYLQRGLESRPGREILYIRDRSLFMAGGGTEEKRIG